MLVSLAVQIAAQGPPPQAPAPARLPQARHRPARRLRRRRQRKRPAEAADPRRSRRSSARPPMKRRSRAARLYETNCRACHGADLRGGDIGGPNLLRSQLVLNDQHGELIRAGRQERSAESGHAADAGAAAGRGRRQGDRRAYIHSVAFTMRGQGSPPPGEEVELNIVVGDAGRRRGVLRCEVRLLPFGDRAI